MVLTAARSVNQSNYSLGDFKLCHRAPAELKCRDGDELNVTLNSTCFLKMAQFGFENDIQSILKLDMPILNAPMARWQRKASSSNTSSLNGLSPGKPTNVSLSSSKTPSKTPGKSKKTPSKIGGDRFIPTRNSKQMDVANFLLTKENEPLDANTAGSTLESQKAWSVSLNGYNIEDAKILHFGGKPLNAPEGYQNNLKVLYSQGSTPASTKKTRYISSTPDRILDAPDLRNDFYLNLLDWGSHNILAVALHNSVYLWDATKGDIILLMRMEREEDYICSLSWTKDGSYLAVGTSDCKVQLWDVENQKRLRSMSSHTARVGSLSWNDHILSSGSRSGHIHHHDVRVADHHIFTLTTHTQEVCGLQWSPDGRYLASGGNDNLVCVWPRVHEGSAGNDTQFVNCWSEHQGAVKALAWCPWQSNILASGGGTSDRHIRIWNVNSGSCISSLDTQSQVSSLVFAPNYKELVSAHGYAHNNVVIWKYPSFSKVAELNGHEDRVLSVILSPDGSTIASVAGDETIRLWKSFELDPVKKKAKDKLTKSTSSGMHQSIR
uniref:Cell division cycle 20 homolog n=1 Tax=Oryzias sinensis TaxID=183150 RepID=A0A8C7ZU66_9TELE